jgi:pyrroline-5-carboxylate reductase
VIHLFPYFQVIAASQIIFICVKPQIVSRCSADFKATFETQKVYVSILAGITMDMLKDLFVNNFEQKQRIKLIRSMPNTSMQVGEGL